MNIFNYLTVSSSTPKTTTPFSVIILCMILFSAISHANAQSFEAAAICVAWRSRCTETLSRTSGVCHKYAPLKKQSIHCVRKACKFCKWRSSKNHSACRSNALKTWCPYAFETNDLSSVVLPLSSSSSDSNSSYDSSSGSGSPSSGNVDSSNNCKQPSDNNRIVFNTASISSGDLPTGWTKTNDNGIVWQKDGGEKIYARGSGEICFDFKVPSSGTYYLTALTSAPHPTEHNDMWLKLSSGIRLIRVTSHEYRSMTTNYIKAYQNDGRSKLSSIISSVNRKPHQFVSRFMAKNDNEQVCVSGRSTLFKVYKVMLLKCDGDDCIRTSNYIRNEMRKVLEC